MNDEGQAAVSDTVREAVEDDDPEIRVHALSTVSQVCHGEFDDPAAVDLERLDGSVRDALGGLVYARPDALDPVIDRAIGWYRTDEAGTSYRLVTDLAPEYPEVPDALVKELADYYTDRYAGEYPYDDTDVAIALAHAAIAEPD